MSTTPAPSFETVPQRVLAAEVRHYTMDTRHAIPAQWQDWFDAGYVVPNAVRGCMYGVSFEVDGTGSFRYGVGIELADPAKVLPEGLCNVTLVPGLYAVERRFAPISTLAQTFDSLFAEWLPNSGHVLREGSVFERYPEDPRNGPDGMAWEIWIPVAPKA